MTRSVGGCTPSRKLRGAATAALFGVSSCASGASPQVSPLLVDVEATEYAFGHRRSVSPGRAVFRIHNAGREAHELIVVALPPDFPPLGQQLRGTERRAVPTIARLPPTEPGETGTFAVDLVPGRYGLICFVSDFDGAQHASKGMSSELRVE